MYRQQTRPGEIIQCHTLLTTETPAIDLTIDASTLKPMHRVLVALVGLPGTLGHGQLDPEAGRACFDHAYRQGQCSCNGQATRRRLKLRGTPVDLPQRAIYVCSTPLPAMLATGLVRRGLASPRHTRNPTRAHSKYRRS
jgi:hypothetical protein